MLEDRRWCVYEHLFPNGKRYVGITSKPPKTRWENGAGYAKDGQPVMYNAIQKYGWDNIEHNVLFTVWAWLRKKNPTPKKYLDRGIRIVE